MENFKQICKELGISPSITRKVIYEYLYRHKTHPTVDEIYQDLTNHLHTLSKTTVYNILKLFAEYDLVNIINTSENEKRYELNDHEHSHFRCKICNKLYDIPKVSISYNASQIPGFSVKEEQVTLVGICPSCMKNNI